MEDAPSIFFDNIPIVNNSSSTAIQLINGEKGTYILILGKGHPKNTQEGDETGRYHHSLGQARKETRQL